MPIYVKISLDDIDMNEFIEYDSELGPDCTATIKEAIIDNIVFECKTAILKIVKEKTVELVNSKIKEYINTRLDGIIDGIFSTEYSKIKIKSNCKGVQDTSAEEYIIEKIERCIKAKQIDILACDTATNYAKKIEERYDKLFASQLLDKMMKANLLKDNTISQLLTEG
ncbi:MAG: hypothetical protein OQK82_06905 [Candidatus Pacearchaeota archaeon]|jgi:hypothetical protein|nr:hypothetical protein [Candidatus Pacearchaeota archaeon]